MAVDFLDFSGGHNSKKKGVTTVVFGLFMVGFCCDLLFFVIFIFLL